VASAVQLASPGGFTELRLRWRVVEHWELPAEELLATEDPGLMPWVPLTGFEGPPEPVLRQCREVIDRRATEGDRSTLLAVTQVFTRLRYNDPGLLEILGGRRAMIESPLLEELKAEWGAEARAEGRARDIVTILEDRFGDVPEEVRAAVQATRDEARLDTLLLAAVHCPDVAAFRTRLTS
jgi:hypothetical protein